MSASDRHWKRGSFRRTSWTKPASSEERVVSESAEDQVGRVLRAVLGQRQQQQAERPARVVVDPADQAEVEQREPAVGREQEVPAVRVGVVDAVPGDLLHVSAEELACDLLSRLRVEAVVWRDLFAVDPLEHEHALGHIRMDHFGYDEVLVVGHEPRDQLGAVGLLRRS